MKSHPILFWFVLVCFGLFWFVLVCFGLFWFVLVCFGLFWLILPIALDSRREIKRR
jgi:hypothetical protein